MKPFDVYPLFDLEIQRSEGCYVWDQHGRRYLDFYGGHAVISVGHSHPHYLQSVKAQMDRVVFYSNSVLNELRDRLCDKLSELSGYFDYQLFMVNSRAEAMACPQIGFFSKWPNQSRSHRKRLSWPHIRCRSHH
ncbi:MAG: aminotransferase class III-fold pyridoxal phosphate-dependent enzyme [Saprospiraceae bacterium]